MAALYASSGLKRRNDGDVAAHAKQRSVIGKESLKELKTRRATVTPFWWALGVLFKVRHHGRVIQVELSTPWTRHGCSATAVAKP